MAKRRSATSRTDEERQAAKAKRDRRNSKRKRRRESKKEGLKLTWWATSAVVIYLCLMAGRIWWTIGDDFPLADVATSIAVWFMISAVVIAVPTLIVWIASRSTKASNATCVAAVCFLFVALFLPVFFTPSPNSQQLSQTDLLDLQARAAAGEDVSDEIAKLTSGFASSLEQSAASGSDSEDKALRALASIMREFEPLIVQQLKSNHAYFSAGAATAIGLEGPAAITKRMALLKQLSDDTNLLVQFLQRLDVRVRSKMASEGIASQDIDQFVSDFERGTQTELLIDLRQKEYDVYQSHYNVLSDLKNKYGRWRLVAEGIVFSQPYEVAYYADFLELVESRTKLFLEAQHALYKAQGKTPPPAPTNMPVSPVAELVAPDNLATRILNYRTAYLRAIDESDLFEAAMAQKMREHKDLRSIYEQDKLNYEQAGALDPATLTTPEIVQERLALLKQLKDSTWAYMKALEKQPDELQAQFESLGLVGHPAERLAAEWDLSSLTRSTRMILRGQVNVLHVHSSVLGMFTRVGEKVTIQPDGTPEFSFHKNAERYEKSLDGVKKRQAQLEKEIDSVVQYMHVHPEPNIPEVRRR